MSSMFIGGNWVAAASGETIPILSPVDGQTFGAIAHGREVDVDTAVHAVQRAVSGAWGKMTATKRGRVLSRLAQKVADKAEDLAQLEARDTGKTMTTARNDMQVRACYFEFYCGAADKVHGQIIPFLDGQTVSVLREPHGVTGHNIPWSYPTQMLGRTLAPALAMGKATHADAAAGAKLAIVTTRLNAGGYTKAVDRVTAVTTPGETPDVVVTEAGVAVHPEREELRERLVTGGVQVVPIEQLKDIAARGAARPKPPEGDKRIVAVVEYRDGTVTDIVRAAA